LTFLFLPFFPFGGVEMREKKQVKNAWKVVWYVYNRMCLLKEELRKQGKSKEEINKVIDEIKEKYLAEIKGETDAYRLIMALEETIKGVLRHEDA